MTPDEAVAFCRLLDSIDEFIDELNRDGSTVISSPADMAAVHERLAVKFAEIRDAAPEQDLAAAFDAARRMMAGTASRLREMPPDAKVFEAEEFSSEGLREVQMLAPVILEFRREHCESDAC